MNSFSAPAGHKSACMKVDAKWEKVEVKRKAKPSRTLPLPLFLWWSFNRKGRIFRVVFHVFLPNSPPSNLAADLLISVVPGQTQTTSADHVALITLARLFIRELVWRKRFIKFNALYCTMKHYWKKKPRKIGNTITRSPPCRITYDYVSHVSRIVISNESPLSPAKRSLITSGFFHCSPEKRWG